MRGQVRRVIKTRNQSEEGRERYGHEHSRANNKHIRCMRRVYRMFMRNANKRIINNLNSL